MNIRGVGIKAAVLLLAIAVSCNNNEDSKDQNSEIENSNTRPENVETQEGMVMIPAGEYLMGGKSEQAEVDEFPRHKVRVSAFLMDVTEVTNQQFKTFVDATGYVTVAERPVDWEELAKQLPPGTPKPADSLLEAGSLVFVPSGGPVDLRDVSQWWQWMLGADWKHPQGPESTIDDIMDHPVVHIALDDALAYAEWAGKRLPTEAEWEWASMGGLDDPKYPWGDTPVGQATDKANFWQGMFPYNNSEQDGYYLSAPVKSFPSNGYGLYDMAGNVWEWCSDKYNSNGYAESHSRGTAIDPAGPERSYDPSDPYMEKYVIRGGSFLCSDSYCSGYRVARRMRTDRDTGLSHTGFRCVKGVES